MPARRLATIAAIVLGSLVGLASVAVAGLRLAHADEALPGVTVEGIDVGGMSADEIEVALAPLVDAREGDPVTLTWRDREFVLDPAAIGYAVDVDATIDAALTAGRGEGFLGDSLNHVTAYWEPRTVSIQEGSAEEALDEWLTAVVDEVDRDPYPGDIAISSELAVAVTPPDDGARVRVDEARDLIQVSLRQPGPETAELPADVIPRRVTVDQVEAVAEQARRALEAPLTLTADAIELTLQPSDLARVIRMQERSAGGDDWDVELVVDEPSLADVIGDAGERFRVQPIDARFDVPRRPPVTFDAKFDATWKPQPAEVPIVASVPGREFDVELAAPQIAEMMRAGQRTAEARLREVVADFSTADAEALGMDTLLATFTSYHPAGQGRVTNIQRLADLVDGTLVLPGEQFSINQISGIRTCAKGFVEAGMILRGEIVDSCGGGVSQFGTATVNAVFFAGLTPDAYKPHSFYISRYPMAREATLNYPSPDIDVKFTNDTGYGILVKTSYTRSSISVSFYGHSDVTEVSADVGSPFNIKPYTTERRVSRDLPPQSQDVIQSGKDGFTVKLTRTITRADGTVTTDDWSNTYVPATEIVEYNPDPKPTPSPTPTPSPAPSPAPSPSPSPSDPPSDGDGG